MHGPKPIAFAKPSSDEKGFRSSLVASYQKLRGIDLHLSPDHAFEMYLVGSQHKISTAREEDFPPLNSADSHLLASISSN